MAIGQELEIELTPERILLKPKPPLAPSHLDDIAGCLAYQGNTKTKTIDEMNEAIRQGMIAEWGQHDSR